MKWKLGGMEKGKMGGWRLKEKEKESTSPTCIWLKNGGKKGATLLLSTCLSYLILLYGGSIRSRVLNPPTVQQILLLHPSLIYIFPPTNQMDFVSSPFPFIPYSFTPLLQFYCPPKSLKVKCIIRN